MNHYHHFGGFLEWFASSEKVVGVMNHNSSSMERCVGAALSFHGGSVSLVITVKPLYCIDGSLRVYILLD